MAGKRLRDEFDQDSDQAGDKRMRRPSLPTVIREAMMMKAFQNFLVALEPLLRRVVREEVEQGLIRSPRLLERPPQMQIGGVEPSIWKLVFRRELGLPIFTGSKIEDEDGNHLQILLVNSEQLPPTTLPPSIKLELLVLDGDFMSDGREDWTGEEFQRNIVKERTGKRPLLYGDVNVTMRDGMVTISELQFTDNSSWIRSRNFRIGARIVPGSYNGPSVKEAMTKPFMVKDHRGELYKKHYPPRLNDEVWRLKKIRKDGPFHKRLEANNIKTVQDFLKLLEVDLNSLREILGQGMSEKMWKITVNHAKTCNVDNKIYVHCGPYCVIYIDSICRIVGIMFGTRQYKMQDLDLQSKSIVQQLIQEAYQQWNTLQEVDAMPNAICLIQNEPIIQDGSGSQQWYPSNQEGSDMDYRLDGFE
ncbi:protein SAR DEFICIENT 1-like [Typha latifolia]|uniref:protein SAR DEFICIENT 1-like n=1 Tax=Typha latifolia TaxID=4733 RepID=UPI003C30CC87